MPSSCIHMDVITRSANRVQAMEICSSGEEIVSKVRKPYTITKQRERWTENEHKKFLEALKLHGRAWRRIEEHIGTKTAVQIRSHAQKFFSKVVRESEGSDTGSMKPIEIPPPRPKRKPSHPYPRKLGHSSHKGISISEQQEGTPSPIPSVSGQDNRSPTSVLSAIGSDMMGSLVSNLPNHCASPDSSASGSNPVSTLMTEQENQCESHSLTDGEENGSVSPCSVTVGIALQGKSIMKYDLGSQDHACSKESLLGEAPPTSLKLFGRTVLVTDPQKPSSSTVGNPEQSHKSLPSVDNQSHKEDLEADFQSSAFTLPGNAVREDFCGGPCKTAWSPWTGGEPPFFYRTPFQRQLVSATEASTTPLPWWAFYRGVPFPLINLQNMSIQQDLVASHTEVPNDREMQKESSWNGSGTASTSEARTSCKDLDTSSPQMEQPSSAPVFHLKPSENSAFISRKAGPEKQMKGFVPYKRCFSKREVQQSKTGGEEKEGQRIWLCS